MCSPGPTHPLMQPPFSKCNQQNNHWLVIYMHSIPTAPPIDTLMPDPKAICVPNEQYHMYIYSRLSLFPEELNIRALDLIFVVSLICKGQVW